ncbi:MAG: trypsin-like peptidase domain-containing protein [Hyphomicrobiaceae bacterium]
MADPGTDLAVLKIIGGGRFEPIEMADSDRVEVGDLVLAVGNPFGVGQTVTMGIISGPLRGRIGKAKHQVFLQTDAAINPGNSGGPLISMSGRLIGINTIILSKSGGSHGIGFAIPSNLAQLVLDSALRGDSRVVWPWIGADLHPVRRDLAQGLGLRRIAGAFVNSVSRNGPAQRAGLMPQDVIVKVDGIDIDDPRLVLYRLALRGIGKRSTLEVIRRGRPVSVTMDITAPPKQSADDVLVLDGNHPLQGATVANISPDMAEERGIAEGIGVLVTAVARNSRVADSLRVDDVIVELLGQRITSVEQIRGLVDTPDRVWPIVVIRDGRRIRGVVR